MCAVGKNRRRIQVGLLVSHLEDDFDAAICEGAMEGAAQADANLVIFSGRYIDGQYADKLRTEFEYQYNTVFSLPVYSKFDVLLVMIGSLGSHLNTERKEAFLRQFEGTPVITISSRIDGYPCIQVDNYTGMEAILDHLIVEHGCERIGFVSGPITNDDARERLDVYRKALQKHGLPYESSRVVFGNFSKYSGPRVEELLDANPDLQAIVFANDQMAFAGYEVLRARGLEPGKDILVTGFDDSPIALEMTPRLTTVRSDLISLGKAAISEAVHYVTRGTLEHIRPISSMVQRNSCGCKGNPQLNGMIAVSRAGDIISNTDTICHFLFAKSIHIRLTQQIREEILVLIRMCADLVIDNHIQEPERCDALVEQMERCICPGFFHCVAVDDLYTVLEYGYQIMAGVLQSVQERLLLSELFIRLYRTVADQYAAYTVQHLDHDHFMNLQTNAITRDMLVYDFYDDKSYLTVVDKLQRLHMASSYLFAYEPTIRHRMGETWTPPEKLYLKAYHTQQTGVVLLEPNQQPVSRSQLFTNPYIPKDRQYTLIAVPLISREEHYGLLMCEIEPAYFHYIQSVTSQLCAALRILTLMKQHAVTQQQLRHSLIELRENNQLLSELSKTDGLTGCLNRRGFYEDMRSRLREAAPNTQMVMIFADLDSLKTINDNFGHAEGDFAIRAMVDILSDALGDDTVMGRLGGDEIVVGVPWNNPIPIGELIEHIEKAMLRYNLTNMMEKAYWVHMSVGVYPFKCTDTVEIGELLSHADALLYEQKRHKKSILKAEFEPKNNSIL